MSNNSNVWIINLKDKRNGSRSISDDKKLKFCLSKNIIGIGWGDLKSRNGIGYTRANNGIENIENGDFVWAKNPETKNVFYLFRVIDGAPVDHGAQSQSIYVNNDIGKSRNVELLKQLTEYELQKEIPSISKTDIVARSTVQNVHIKRIIDATNNYVATL